MKKHRKIILSMVLMAAFLPVLLWMVIGRDKFTMLTQAEGSKVIRIWMEPAEVVLTTGKTYEFRIMAESENPDTLVPKIDLKLIASEGLILGSDKVSYHFPFAGKKEIGKVVINAADTAGRYVINIDAPSVVTGLTEVPVLVAPAVVIVQ
jgi:hypothetical protein